MHGTFLIVMSALSRIFINFANRGIVTLCNHLYPIALGYNYDTGLFDSYLPKSPVKKPERGVVWSHSRDVFIMCIVWR